MEGAGILIAAFVGTTMAAATFLSRPLFIQGKGWTRANLGTQRNDAIIAAVLIFSISGAIMAVASGSLYGSGSEITQVFNVFALPLVVSCFLLLWNRKNAGLPTQKWATNFILLGALVFSLIIMGNGLVDIFG